MTAGISRRCSTRYLIRKTARKKVDNRPHIKHEVSRDTPAYPEKLAL
jgi:hypothetical protein